MLRIAAPVQLALKTPYWDGTMHIVMSPLEFMQQLAALVPRPRLSFILFHGVLAPNRRKAKVAHPMRMTMHHIPQLLYASVGCTC